MSKIAALAPDDELLNQCQLILETAGFEYIGLPPQAKSLSRLRNAKIDLCILGEEGWEQVYQQLKADAILGQTPVIVLYDKVASPEAIADDRLQDPDQTMDAIFAPQELLTTVVQGLQAVHHNLPTAAERTRQFHQNRPQLAKQFKQADRDLRATHRKYTRYINRQIE